MTTAEASPSRLIVEALQRAGITLVASLPDKWLVELIDEVETDPRMQHVRVAREEDGFGLCAGAYLGGRRAAVVCQNAGLLLSGNTLAGLAHHHQIPVLALAAYRGTAEDAYYYQVYKGRVTEPVLNALGVPHVVVHTRNQIGRITEAANQAVLARSPVVVLLSRQALLGTTGMAL